MIRSLLVAFVSLVTVAAAVSQERLRVHVAHARGAVRSGGPIPVIVETVWNGPGVLQGRLRFVARDHLGVRIDVTTEAFAIPAGAQRVARLFPAATAAMNAGPLDLRTTFTTDSGDVMRLPAQEFVVPAELRRSVVVATLALPRGDRVPPGLLKPNVAVGDRARDPSLVVHHARLAPDDAPATSIGWCTCDIVFATLEALVALDAGRFDALARWVDGGGSVFVWNARSGASTPGAAERLRRWHPGTVDEGGSISCPAGLFPRQQELGRVLFADREAAAATSIDWLWKPRHASEWIQPQDDVGRRVLHDDRDAAIVDRLLPDDVQMVPTGLLAVLLLAFIFAVGPGDWFLLGKLGRRWLTWITFPTICVLFTLVMIAVTDAYLGQRNRDETLVLIDVGADGRVLRRNALHMHFPTGERVDRHEIDGALVSVVDVGRYREHYYGSTSTPASPRWYGRIGGRTTFELRHRKWTPVMWRTLSFAAPETVPALGGVWAAPATADLDALRFADGIDSAFVVSGETSQDGRATDERSSIRQQVVALTSRRTEGYFRDVAMISPTGGDALEDIAILDGTDPGARVLVVVTRDGDDWVVYRRAFRATED